MTEAQRGQGSDGGTPNAGADVLTAPFGGAPIFTRARALRPTGKVLPEHARSHNRSLVLQTLYTSGAQSRADVARETGLTRVTISDLVAGLIAEGLVIELGQREDARPGKPATLIDVDRAAFHIVGVDLSEHQRFLGAVVDLDGGIVSRAETTRAECGAASPFRRRISTVQPNGTTNVSPPFAAVLKLIARASASTPIHATRCALE